MAKSIHERYVDLRFVALVQQLDHNVVGTPYNVRFVRSESLLNDDLEEFFDGHCELQPLAKVGIQQPKSLFLAVDITVGKPSDHLLLESSYILITLLAFLNELLKSSLPKLPHFADKSLLKG
jgi:hypothetical protein